MTYLITVQKQNGLVNPPKSELYARNVLETSLDRGNKRLEKRWYIYKITCLEHSTGEKVSFTHDSFMIGYERGLLHEHSGGFIFLEGCIVLAVPLSH